MGSAPTVVGLAVVLFLLVGLALVLFDRRTRRSHKWAHPTACVVLGLSTLALVLSVYLAVFHPDLAAEYRGS